MNWACTCFLLIVSSLCDFTMRKIPNIVTFPFMILGLYWVDFPFSKESYIRIMGCICLFCFGSLRLMGLGDLKLIMAVLCMRGIQESMMMTVTGILFLFIYILFEDYTEVIHTYKNLYQSFLYGIPVRVQSKKTYPFAVFLCMAYFFLQIFWGIRL